MFDLGKINEAMEKVQGLTAQLQEKSGKHRIETIAAGGKVKVTMNARKEVSKISIEPGSLQDPEEMVDLLLGALHRGYDEADAWMQSQMPGMGGGFDLSQIAKMFGK